jgi:hypothetical protein
MKYILFIAALAAVSTAIAAASPVVTTEVATGVSNVSDVHFLPNLSFLNISKTNSAEMASPTTPKPILSQLVLLTRSMPT